MARHLGEMNHAAQRDIVITRPFRPKTAFRQCRAKLPIKTVFAVQRKVDEFWIIVQKSHRGRNVVVPKLAIGSRFRKFLRDLRQRVKEFLFELLAVSRREAFVIVNEIIAIRHVHTPERFRKCAEENMRRPENGIGGGILQIKVGELQQNFTRGLGVLFIFVNLIENSHPHQMAGEQAIVPAGPRRIIFAAGINFVRIFRTAMLIRPEFFVEQLDVVLGTGVHFILINLLDRRDKNGTMLQETINLGLMLVKDFAIPGIIFEPLLGLGDIGRIGQEARVICSEKWGHVQ
ncbi:MAG: hypothetical protein ILNGONEN_01540 [Syntrophorhabdaceae bacterium]|nr:hypothetical protein [Syntrophorhabdaceae bacterium]